MAKVAVYEGNCPACSLSDYGQIALTGQAITNVLQGGAIGAATGMAADFVAQKLLRITNPLLRGILSVAVPIGIAMVVQKQNPRMAENIAIGGAAVGIYSLLKGLIGPRLGLQGLEGLEGFEAYGELPEVEVTEGYEALVPEVEEMEGYGALVPEVEEMEGYGEEIYVEE